jgi:hypothetical protein
MPVQLLLGTGDGRLRDRTADSGAVLGVPRLGRALAAGDLDNDGRVDVLVQSLNEPLAWLHNRTEAGGHFLTILLEGTRAPRDGLGARVAVTAGGNRRLAVRYGGGSYQSAGDPRLHFGLGPATAVDRVEVTWPSGRVDRHENLAADAGYRLVEGATHPLPLAGFPRRGSAPQPASGPLTPGGSRRYYSPP